MALEFKRGISSSTANAKRKVLLYAKSGEGKTWMAATCGVNTVVLLTEKNGEQAVRCANPHARYAVVTNAADLREFCAGLISGSLSTDDDPIDSVVFDGLTEIQQLFKDELLGKLRKEMLTKVQTGAKLDDDDVFMTLEMWGLLSTKMRLFLRMVRNLDYNVVCTALAEDELIGDKQYLFPSFQGKKLYGEVMQYFDAVAWVQRDGKDEDAKHWAWFDPPNNRISGKPQHPIRGRREGPMSAWFTEWAEAADSSALLAKVADAVVVPTEDVPAEVAQDAPLLRRRRSG